MVLHGREARQVALDSVELISAALSSARDPERLAKIRSGKLPVEDDELRAIREADRVAAAETVAGAAKALEDWAALEAWRLQEHRKRWGNAQ